MRAAPFVISLVRRVGWQIAMGRRAAAVENVSLGLVSVKELYMSKWMAVAALGAMLAVVGCDKNKDDSSDPMKMSSSSKSSSSSSSCAECSGAKKNAAEPKKLSAGSASADCQTQCPAGAAK
jgi:hypothetical protein